jgi:glycine reductase
MKLQASVVHYINQYFAGIGGEEKSDLKPESKEGPVGPGIGLQNALGAGGSVVATVYSGDSYMAEHGEKASKEIVKLIASFQPDVVVAGPSFGSGRYGLACGQVCAAVQAELKVPTVAAMFEDSPGAEQYRKSVVIVPTKETAAGMGAALPQIARLALKLARGEALGSPEEDGYIARGYRQNEFASERGATRAVNMLLKKLKGEPFTTEWPLPKYDPVKAPAPLAGTKGIKVALVSEGGVVPKGNPDHIPSAWATKWAKYDLSGVTDLTARDFETVHGGFDTTSGNRDPDRLVPVDTLRELEQAGDLTLQPELYSTVGGMGSLTEMRRIGSEIARELRKAGVDAVIVGAT